MHDRAPNSVVVVRASAGGVDALKTLAAGLPRDLPANTIAHDDSDRVLPLRAIPPAIAKLVEELTRAPAVSDSEREDMSLETSHAALEPDAADRPLAPGEPSAFSCPACGGVLWEPGRVR